MPFFTHNQHRYFYREQDNTAEPNAPLLIALPGNTATSACLINEMAFFSGLGYRAAAIDFLGTGQSDRIPTPWPLDWWQMNAEAAIALVDHLGARQAVLVGVSGGAIAALYAAIRFPERVRAVISDSTVHTFLPGQLSAEVMGRAERNGGQVGFWTYANGPDWEAVVDADSDFLRRLDEANPQGVDLFGSQLSQIRCPVLFSASLADGSIPQAAAQVPDMSAQVKGSWVFTVNAGDHPLMWSCPKAFQAAAKAFLASIE